MTARGSIPKSQLFPRIVGVISSLADLHIATRMSQPPDLFELRLDHLCGSVDQLENKLSMLHVPLIITARHPLEGGANNLSIKQRGDLLSRFLPHAKYIDIELRSAKALKSLLDLARRRNVRRIISLHALRSTPTTRRLCAKARMSKSCGADIFKVATRTDTPAQLARLLDFVANPHVDLAVSAMGIGALGAISRIILARRGSTLVYAPVGRSRVEGQLRKVSRASIVSGLSIRELRSLLMR